MDARPPGNASNHHTSIHCPICRGQAVPKWTLRGHVIHQCTSCQHQFVHVEDIVSHVANVYDDRYFQGGGAGYGEYLSLGALLRKRGQCYARIVRRWKNPPGTLLDIGAAAGFLLQGWCDEGWQGTGIEPNPTMASWGRKNLQMDVRCGTFESIPTSTLPRVDCIAMVQIISHLPLPLEAIRKARELLNHNGILLIETWDRGSWSARLAGKSWHEYSPPSVLHWFTRESLVDVAKSCGFELLHSQRVVRWIQAGHAKSMMRHVGEVSKTWKVASLLATPIPSKLSLPYLSDDLFAIVLRKTDEAFSG